MLVGRWKFYLPTVFRVMWEGLPDVDIKKVPKPSEARNEYLYRCSR